MKKIIPIDIDTATLRYISSELWKCQKRIFDKLQAESIDKGLENLSGKKYRIALYVAGQVQKMADRTHDVCNEIENNNYLYN